MGDTAHQLVDSLDMDGCAYVLGWMSVVLDSDRAFTAEDLVRAVASYRATHAAGGAA